MATAAEIALALQERLMSDPKHRKSFLSLVKGALPNAPIPELDAAAPVEAEIGKLQGELAALKQTMANDKQDGQINAKFSALQAARGYTDEGMTGLKELMVAKKIADPEAAADHFDKINFKPAPIEPSGYSTQAPAFDGGTMEEWFSNPDLMTDKTIGEIFTESRAGRLN